MKNSVITTLFALICAFTSAQFPGQPVYPPENGTRFGNSVSMQGDYALIGDYYESILTNMNEGVAYFYKRVNDSLVFHQKIWEPEVQIFGSFGFSTAINEKYAVVGAPHHLNSQANGTAFIYRLNDGEWQRQSLLTDDNSAGFGYSVAVDSITVIVGAPFGPGVGAPDSKKGEARIYKLTDENGTEIWKEITRIAPANGYDNGCFGYDVDISGNYIIAGGYPTSTYFPGRSACYIYENENGNWVEKQRLFPEGMETTFSFGKSVAIYNGTAAVAAPGEVNEEVVDGAVYIFERINGVWVETARIVSPDAGEEYKEFGRAVDLQENRVIIGSQKAVYIYEKRANGWELLDCTHRSSSNGGYYYHGYGSCVALSDSVYLAGAYDEYHNGKVQGAAHFYEIQKPVPVAEREALVALFHSTDGTGWKANYKWNSMLPVYQWYGVEVVQGHVTTINLTNNSLKGSIPAELGNLPELTHLNLNYNELSGSVPSELGNCKKLTFLSLDNNQLSGMVPSSLNNLKLLQDLWLNNNQLSGDMTGMFAGFRDLIYFGINNNNFTGEVDLSSNAELKLCYVKENQLRVLNLKNGNNGNITNHYFDARSNPNLSCIIVDNTAYSEANWQYIDSTATFVESESICTITHLSPVSLKNESYYPNPTKGRVNFKVVAERVRVFNTAGQLVMERKNVAGIDLSSAPDGLYYIHVLGGEEGRVRGKIVKCQSTKSD